MKFLKFCIVIILIKFTFSPVTSQASDRPVQILSSMGFNIINTVPQDFSIPSLDGKDVSLESYKGNWIWLVFWATWCGPCQAEMPSLEKLHKEVGGDKLKILGVSIDSGDSTPVKRFIRRKGITFPILHDTNNVAASKYQASAVPMIYVISPDWKLVGIFRGGTSWESQSVFDSVKELISHKEVTVKDIPQTSKPGEVVELPNDLIPPKLSLSIPAGKIMSNSDFKVKVNVSFEGEVGKYLIKTPVVTLPEELKELKVGSQTHWG